MEIKGIVKPNFVTSGENLWLYRNNHLSCVINIDRTFFGRDWCVRHGMKKTEEVVAENGERFDIYERKNELICAIPAVA